MVRTLLIAAPVIVSAGCSGAAQPPVAAPVPGTPAAVPDALWDKGTFVVVDKEHVVSATEESFEIWKTSSGFRFVVSWKRPLPTGEPADGAITLETDARFSPTTGDDVMTLHAAGGDQVTKSSIRREPDGRLATVSSNADGSKDENTSQKPNDWFIGGRFTSFLTALCQANPDFTAPVVYPDKATTLAPLKQLPIEGSTRDVKVRVLTYVDSKNEVIAACEDGKVVGEVTRGTTIVRTGDMALARTLEKWFR